MKLEVTDTDPKQADASRDLLDEVWRALEREPKLRDLQQRDVRISLGGSELVLEGEVADVPSKTRALFVASQFKELDRIVDRLVVEPAVPMKDGAMRDSLMHGLVAEPAFSELRLILRASGDEVVAQDPVRPQGTIRASIEDGIVTLGGDVPGFVHKRIAVLLAWWVPGTRSVRDELAAPYEDDSDEALNDAVLAAIDKDPLLDSDQIGVATRDRCVTLAGTLPSEEQRQIAERDAWYVGGVVDVDNRITVEVQ